MQEFLKNEQDKYIYYYNDNELEQFYVYQQMPENNEINMNNKQEFFKRIFREWKSKQINFLLKQITLDIQTYFSEKLNLASSLTEIEILLSILNSKEADTDNEPVEKVYLNDLVSCKNPSFILRDSDVNFSSIPRNNSVPINQSGNFTNNFNVNNNYNSNNYLNSKAKSSGDGENNKLNYSNTVSINDISNSCGNKFTYEDNKTSNLAFKEIDFSFFSNRDDTEKLISYLHQNSKGIEKEMLLYVQEELERNAYLRNESICFLLDTYNSIFNSGNKQKAECII